MNKVFLIGRLSRDPELRHTTSGMAVCQINVAISRRMGAGRDPETDFINVVVWDKHNVEFLGSATDNNTKEGNNFDANPFDQDMPSEDVSTTSVDNDPFASFGEKVEISDNDLPF